MKLYELTNQYLALAEMADDPDMPPEVLADSLEGLQGDIQTKAQALMQVVSGMKADTDAIDGEIKRLQHRKKVIENRTESLKDYLRHNMAVTGINKIECPFFTVTLVKPKPMVVIENEAYIPEQFIKTETIKRPIKADILKALKAGENVPGCALGESRQSINIT